MYNKKAYSLIELSIVILIIGILVAGIVGSSRLVQKSRLSAARSLTNAAPIASIDSLIFWLEPTLVKSISSSSTGRVEIEDGETVGAWYNNDHTNFHELSLTQSTTANQPVYRSDGIAGLPSVEISSNKSLSLANSPATAGDPTYTVFLVWKPLQTVGSFSRIVVGTPAYIVANFSKQIETHFPQASYIRYSGANGYEKDNISIVAIEMEAQKGEVRFYNNSTTPVLSTFTAANVSSAGSGPTTITIGHSSDTITAQVSELIVFDDALKNAEIEDVFKYLSGKYKVKLN